MKNNFIKVHFERKKNFFEKILYLFIIFDITYMVYSFITRKSVMLFSIVLLFFFACLYIAYMIITFSKKQIAKKLVWLVEQNKYYTLETNSDGEKYFSYLPDLSYKISKENLYVSFVLDGSNISKHYRDLRITLQDCFNMACVSAIEDNGRITYKLVQDKYFDPLIVDENTDYTNFCNNECLKLNQHLTWYYRNSPHALVTGSTGRGKTYILIYMLRCFKAINAKVYVIDPKHSDLLRLGDMLDCSTASEANYIAKMLRETEELMIQRYKDLSTIGTDYLSLGLSPVFIVFDELLSFFGGSSDEKVKKQVRNSMLELITKGRQAGIFIILGTQRGDVQFLGGSGAIRDQLGLRIILCGSNTSETAIEMTLGSDFKHVRPRFTNKGEGLIYIENLTDIPQDYKAPRIKNPWIVKM